MNLSKENLKQFFGKNKTFQKEDLQNFYNEFSHKNSEQDFFWYLYNLQQENIIKTIDKNTYELVQNKLNFLPIADDFLQKINQKICSKFDLKDYCIWSSAWLNEFTLHQNTKNFTIVEVEKEAVEFVFNSLKKDFSNVFLLFQKTDNILIERYIFDTQDPIIVSKIITKSPIHKVSGVFLPKIEKILLDLFCDEALLIAYKGYEQETIFRTVLKKYNINLKTLFAYAKRRRKEEQIKEYLYQNFEAEIKFLLP